MKIFRIFILMAMVCFICNITLADDIQGKDKNTAPGELQDALETTEPGIALLPELSSGTTIDDETLIKLQESMRYSELANLQLATVELAIKKASSDYFNTFKIWLALNGVKQEAFDKWEIEGNKAVLKKKE